MGDFWRGGGLAAGLLLGLASCTDLELRAYAGYMQSKLTGDIGLASSGSPSSVSANVDVENALGTDNAGSVYVRTEAEVGIVRLTASAFQYDSGGTGTLNADFGNISAGLPVNTDMQIDVIKGAVTFDLIDLDFLRVSPGVALDYFHVDTTVTAIGLNTSETLDTDVPVPMPFLQVEGDVGPVALTVGGGGMSINYGDVQGTYWDLEGLLRLQPFGPVELFAGYRWIRADSTGTASGQDFSANVDLQGWFLGGGLAF